MTLIYELSPSLSLSRLTPLVRRGWLTPFSGLIKNSADMNFPLFPKNSRETTSVPASSSTKMLSWRVLVSSNQFTPKKSVSGLISKKTLPSLVSLEVKISLILFTVSSLLPKKQQQSQRDVVKTLFDYIKKHFCHKKMRGETLKRWNEGSIGRSSDLWPNNKHKERSTMHEVSSLHT